MKRSKRYNSIKNLVDNNKFYKLDEALEVLPKLSNRKVAESIELHLGLNLSEKESKKGVGGNYTLPHSIAKDVKIVVIAEPKDQSNAKKAGADEVGLDDIVKKIEGGWVEFDVLIATPSVMGQLAKLGKILGPKGLMPSPKNETITTSFEKVIKSFRAGKSNFKMDKSGSIHTKIAVSSMKADEIKANFIHFIKTVNNEGKIHTPGGYKSIYMKSSMSPVMKLDVNDIFKYLT